MANKSCWRRATTVLFIRPEIRKLEKFENWKNWKFRDKNFDLGKKCGKINVALSVQIKANISV